MIVPLIDRDEFERGKLEAAKFWAGRGDAEAAAAFAALELGGCGFGLDASARIAWASRGALDVGLRFDLETGEYVRSFVRRMKRP